MNVERRRYGNDRTKWNAVLQACVWSATIAFVSGAVAVNSPSSWRQLVHGGWSDDGHNGGDNIERWSNKDVDHDELSATINKPSRPVIPGDVETFDLHIQPSHSRRSEATADDSDDEDHEDDGKQWRRRLPQAIIIGVKKGGTRALLEFLNAHPGVRAPSPEIHFFDRHYERGLNWYRQQMPRTNENHLTVEKTPSYFVTKMAPSRIYNMSATSAVRLIMVVRDPVTRAISDYTQAVTKRPNLPPFERLAFLDPSPSTVDNGSTADHRRVDTSWGAIKIGLYARHLERWLRHFRSDHIHFVNGERLVTDPAAELGLVQDFLGLRRVITSDWFYFNSTKKFPCLRTPVWYTNTPRADANDVDTSSTLSSLSGNRSLANRTSSPIRCLGKTKGRIHPAIDEDVLQRLRDFYRPFNEKFYRMAGIDFGWP